jgi:hypothetical protein
MTKEEIAGALEQIATLLELKNKNPFQNPGLHECRGCDPNIWRKRREFSG